MSGRVKRDWQEKARGTFNGFTFVELLVMIAIASIVLAMLLPLLQRAMLTARLTSCASNLKQFSGAFTMYADDYNGHMPAPWNTQYEHYLRDAWYAPDTRLPLGLAVFFRDSYLTDGNLVFCPDNTGPMSKREDVLLRLEAARSGTPFNSTAGNAGSYVVNIAGLTDSTCQHAWDWPNYIGYYEKLGVASRISGNLPGGRNHDAVNRMTARIRSPRPYMACGFPNIYRSYSPHSLNSFNTLYADGVIQRIRLTPATYQLLKLANPRGVFSGIIVPSYPNYLPPH